LLDGIFFVAVENFFDGIFFVMLWLLGLFGKFDVPVQMLESVE
jgi:hypothetical protein